MQCQASICPICCSDYDDQLCIPRIIPDCGHTICSECIKTLLKKRSDAKCPLDKGRFPPNKPNVEDYKINYGLKQLLEEAATFESCLKHSERIRLYCSTCKQKVCDDCVHFGDHRDHDIRPLKEIQPAIDEKKKDLESSITRFDRYTSNATTLLTDLRVDMKKVIEARFQEMNTMLQMKEQEMYLQLDTFIESQKLFISDNIGLGSNIKKELSEKLSDYRDINRCNDIFQLISQDIKPLTSKFSDEILKERFDSYSKSINDIMTSFTQSLTTQTLSIAHFPIPNKEIFETNLNFLRLYDEKISPTESVLEKIPIKGGFSFDLKEDLLEVELNESQTESFINPQEFKNVKKLKLVFNLQISSLHLFSPLFTILQQVQDIESLEVTTKNKNINDSVLVSATTAIAWKIRTLKSLKIDFQGCINVHSFGVSHFIRKVLEKVTTLQSLDINLSSTSIRDDCLIEIGKSITHLVKDLESFNLALQGTAISASGLSEIFMTMPKLKALGVNLMQVYIQDDALEMLRSRTLPSIKNLENLCLLLSDTQIGDIICTQLFTNMENVKEFALALNNTQITDATVEVLASALIGIASNIENFALVLDRTRVSDDGVTQICGLMENTKDFFLSLNETRVTDKTLEAFSEITLPSMKNLKNLHLGFKSTQITDKSATTCVMNMQGIPSFTLDFDRARITDAFAESFAKALSIFTEVREFNLSVAATNISSQGFNLIQNAQRQVIERNQA
jgi:hypothetical protein